MRAENGHPTPVSKWSRSELVIPGLVLLVLLLWWSFFLFQAEKTVFARVPVLDEVYYLDRATDAQPPAQGYFISSLYPRLIRWAGSATALEDGEVASPARLRGIRIVQAACWIGTVFLLYGLTRRSVKPPSVDSGLGWWVCWLPSVLFVLYRPMSIYSVTILLELPLVFLVTLFLFLLTFSDQKTWPPLALGLTLGLAGLLRGSVLVLWPLAAWSIWKNAITPRHKFLHLLLLLVATSLPLLPPSLTNSKIAGKPAGPTFNGGVNLYVGNGPEANGFYVASVPGDWRRDPAGQDFLSKRLNLSEVSLAQADSIWTHEALASMRSHPGRTFRLWVKKFWLHFQAWEIDQLTPLNGWTREVPMLRAQVLPFGWLVVLGLAGAGFAWKRPGQGRIWGVAFLLLVTAQSLFFVVTRYRLVLVPLLCLLAGLGVFHLVHHLREKDGRWWHGVVAGCLGLLMTVPWGLTEVKAHWVPLAQANEARRWGVLGEAEGSAESLVKASELYQLSVDGQPSNPGPWLGLAVTFKAQGHREQAREVLGRAILQVDRNLEIRRMLVGLLLEDEMRSDALVQAQSLLRHYPEDGETLHNAAVLLAGFGHAEAALKMADRLVKAHPEDIRGALDQGVLLARMGRKEDARIAFQRGLQFNPGHPELTQNLDLLNSAP